MPTVVTIRRAVLNSKTLNYVLGGLLLLYIGHDLMSEKFGSSEIHGAQDRMKREADTALDVNDEDDPSLSRLARKILNESESYKEIDGKKKPIPVKELNPNYKEAKEAFYAPKPECIPKPPPGSAGADAAAPPAADAPPAAEAPAAEEAPPPPPPEERRRKKRSKLPYCEDLKKDGKKGGGGEGAAAAPPPAGEAPPAAEEAPPPPPAEE